MLTAITRKVSASLNNCELSFRARTPIDVAQAAAQHQAYQDALRQLGARVITLPAEPRLPDAVFVEDAAVVLDEIAVIARAGAASRQAETASVAAALAAHRPLVFIKAPATLEGGDVLRVGRTLYVGLTARTNAGGIEQLRQLTAPYGYRVVTIAVPGCLHLKTGCVYLGAQTLLVNRRWVEVAPFSEFTLLDVPADEPWAANALRVGATLLLPRGLPGAQRLLEDNGCDVRTLDISELQKAEAGLTCLSLLF